MVGTGEWRRMAVAGEWQSLENGSRWRMVGTGEYGRRWSGSRWRMVSAGEWQAPEKCSGQRNLGARESRASDPALDFSGDYISLAPTFLWRLHFSGDYISRNVGPFVSSQASSASGLETFT